jgi:hypothetical protein
MLPHTLGERQISRMPLLDALPRLAPLDASVLVIAARQYQEAIWVAEADPQRAWLLLISAVETVASRWSMASLSPVERLRTSRPRLEAILDEGGGIKLVEAVATEIAPYMGATVKFRDFLLAFLPDPPTKRAPVPHRIPWETKYLKRAFERLYGYRSRTLHGGAAFPSPLCEPPDGLEELTKGSSISGRHVWKPTNVPMFLHVFEYIVRGALLAWWQMLVPPANSA